MSLWIPFAAMAGAFGLAAVATGWLIPRLERVGVVDEPNQRSSHVHPTPRGGGIALAVVSTGCAVFLGIALEASSLVFVIMAGASVLGLLGFADDLRDLGVRIRLGAQVIVTLLVLAGGVSWSSWAMGLVGLAVGVPFVAGSTNVFNFMDGIDGIASGTGLTAGLVAVVTGVLADEAGLVAIGAAIAGASGGFLIHNWSPASVFLGDVGSLFLGFTLSTVVVLYGIADPVLGLALLAPLLPFLIDGALTMLARARRGERLTEAHRSHLYQRAGRIHGHAVVAAAYGASSLIAGLVVALAGRAGLVPGAVAFVLCAAVFTVACVRLGTALRADSPTGSRDV